MTKFEVNIGKASNLSICVTLEKIQNELDFLKTVNDDGVALFYEPNFIKNAIRRYEHFWIPFLAQNSLNEVDDLQFVPPAGNRNTKKRFFGYLTKLHHIEQH